MFMASFILDSVVPLVPNKVKANAAEILRGEMKVLSSLGKEVKRSKANLVFAATTHCWRVAMVTVTREPEKKELPLVFP